MQGAAVQLDEGLGLRYVDREFRAPAPGELRLRVEWAGICDADLDVVRTGRWIDRWPAIPGHEVFGRVDAVGPGIHLAIGTPVVADPRLPCDDCTRCEIDPARCRHLARLGRDRAGGFATHCVLPAASARPVGDVDGSIAVMAEPLACALHGLARLARRPRRVALLGHGPLGALAHVALGLEGPDVDVVVAEAQPRRAQLARALGALVDDDALVAGGFDAVIDTIGSAGSIARALQLCADEGRTVVLAEPGPDADIRAASLIERELVICRDHAFGDELPRAVAMLVEHPHRFRPLITEAIELPELPEVLHRESQAPRGVKVVVRP